jgi:hypothetical protein
MNLRAYRSTLADLKRSYHVCALSRQVEAPNGAETNNRIKIGDASSPFSALIVLRKCQIIADMTVCESDDEIRQVFTLCSLLLCGETEHEANLCERNTSVPLQKTWLFLTLGLLLLKELMTLDSRRRKIDQLSAVQAAKFSSIRSACKDLANRRIPLLLEHAEARVRKMCSEILFLVASDEKEDFSVLIDAATDLHPIASLEYFPLYQSIGKRLILKISDDLHRSATSRCTNMGDDAFIALDDTTGNIHPDTSYLNRIEYVHLLI